MKVADLEGALLALWVAKAEGIEQPLGVKLYASGPCLYKETPWGGGEPFDFRPDSRWAHGGPIIDRENIGTMPFFEGGARYWMAAHASAHRGMKGNTPLIAAMRVYVASKFGEEIPEVPL
ncbi:phage protein NinX family protein [Cupriavidus basilensis]|uniref:DUF2591 domain-containing protein n=1 Tax=Cupriavidus basilensis TaxID=68895 RepID=A0A0C4Y7Q7_9BURK|nr:phage protein NinX family protein [Cupriavidus basilensis]AJG19050.1 hypothetical protein RR42_m1653 [Cupriavidus basilensis]